MRVCLFLFFFILSFSAPALAWQHIHADTIPEKKDIGPIKIPLPKVQPFPHKDTVSRPRATKDLLAFPFVVKSLETNWGFGAIAAYFFKPGKKDTTVRTSDVNLLGLYTLRSQVIVALSSTIFFPKENHIFRFQSSYSYYPDDFWGLGNHTPDSAKEGFSQTQYYINPQFLKRVHKALYVGLTYEFQHTDPVQHIEGGLFDQENIVGRDGGITSGIGPIVSWDTRNNAYSPDKGGFAEIQYVWFPTFLASDFKFTVLSIDLRKFIKLDQNSVLAGQALGGLTFGSTPFRKLEELGGTDMMRGYYGGRYTDKCLMAYQVEYRRHLFWRIGMVAFAATGEVGSTPAAFRLDGLHYTGGAGARFALSKEEKLNLRIDFGVAQHSTAFTVQLREAF
jgi:hypothetical protein